jgi:hypothetical protein
MEAFMLLLIFLAALALASLLRALIDLLWYLFIRFGGDE